MNPSRVLAFCATVDVERLARLIAPRCCTYTSSLGEFERALRTEGTSIAVFDPTIVHERHLDRVLGMLSSHAAGTLLYTRLGAIGTARLLLAAARGLSEFALIGVDDDGASLRARLDTLSQRTAQGLILEAIAPHTLIIPEPLRSKVVGLFTSEQVPESVEALSEACGVPIRTIERQLNRVGIRRGPRFLIACARAAFAWETLLASPRSVEAIAFELKFSDPRTMRLLFQRVAGTAPDRARRTMDSQQFAAAVITRLIAPRRAREVTPLPR